LIVNVNAVPVFGTIEVVVAEDVILRASAQIQLTISDLILLEKLLKSTLGNHVIGLF
jgi:hypothetical protein